MKIKSVLIVCQYSQQPPYNTMLRYHNFAKCLAKDGYIVDILTSSVVHNTNIDMVDTLGTNNATVDGVNYHYIKTSNYSNNGIKRIINMHQFCSSIHKYRKSFKPDCLIVCGAYLYKYVKKSFKKAPIILDIVDLWPQSIVEYANKSVNHPLIQYLYYVEKKAYIKTDALLFSMEGGKDYVKEHKYSRKVDDKKVFHINMGIDLKQHDINLKFNSYKLPWNPNNFNIGYCGSIRQANNVKQICDAALVLKTRGYDKIQFQIYGNGDELDSLKAYCTDNSIDNVHFYGRIEKEKIPFILSNTKANILTYKQVNLMKYGGSQSKLFDYLAVGRPIICNAKFGYNLISRYDCGLITETQDSISFANTVETLYSMDEDEIEKMGVNARKTAELYDLPKLVDQLKNIFDYLSH